MHRAAHAPALRILSNSLKRLEHRHGAIFYGRREVSDIEIAGVCIEAGRRFIRVLDFCGEVFMTKNGLHAVQDVSYVFVCRPYAKGTSIGLHCRSARKIDMFEELFFWAESVSLLSILDPTSRDKEMRLQEDI